MLFVPPRHGKSEMVTVRYPVWRLEHEPSMRVIVGAYSQILANKFSRKARRIAESRFALAADRSAVEDWETPDGGGFRAIGVGGGITGQGGNLIIIDDPVKSREEAESQAYRDRCYEWYTDDLYTRLEPDGAMILIMTRWHVDDLAGRILASDDGPNWAIIRLPAEAEEHDSLGRAFGEALCPSRYPVDILQRIHTVLGPNYDALYQQRPVAREGNLAKREWFPIVEAAPAQAQRIRSWDFAATEKSAKSGDPDYTVGARLCTAGGIWYLEHVIRGRYGPGAVEQVVRQTAETDGRGVQVAFEQEGGSSGKLFAASLVKLLAGWTVRAVPVTGDKVQRAMPWLRQAEAGNFRLVRGAWNAAFLDEIVAFPQGSHDDMIDSVSLGFSQLTQRGWSRGPAA